MTLLLFFENNSGLKTKFFKNARNDKIEKCCRLRLIESVHGLESVSYRSRLKDGKQLNLETYDVLIRRLSWTMEPPKLKNV
jgi:hypothetical protein